MPQERHLRSGFAVPETQKGGRQGRRLREQLATTKPATPAIFGPKQEKRPHGQKNLGFLLGWGA
jgi:hypothetical protein